MKGLSACASSTANQPNKYKIGPTAEQTTGPWLLKIMWSLYVLQKIGLIKRAVSSSVMWLLHFWIFVCACYSLWKLAETEGELEGDNINMWILSVLFLSPLSERGKKSQTIGNVHDLCYTLNSWWKASFSLVSLPVIYCGTSILGNSKYILTKWHRNAQTTCLQWLCWVKRQV